MLTPAVSRRLADSEARLVVTGAGGWLGMATLDLLGQALGPDLAGRVHCFGASARELTLRGGQTLAQRPLSELGDLPSAPTYLLHLAFLTKDRAEEMAEEDYVRANRGLSQSVLDSLDRIGVTGLFVASSGAAAKAEDPHASPAMRLYGSLKRADEDMFSAWAERTGKSAVIGRIFNLSGPYINKVGNYALACFILDALAGRPIEVKAPHPVVRGYVAISELMSLVFALLLEETRGTVRFETGGEPMELEQVARIVADEIGDGALERAAIVNKRPDRYLGDDRTWQEWLGSRGITPVPFPRQVRETADDLARR